MGFNIVPAANGQLPDFLRKVGYVDSGLGSGIAPKAPKMSMTTAKEFVWEKDGQRMILPEKSFKAIIVAAADNLQKAWYSKGYTPGSTESPDCFSRDGKLPDATSRQKQCSNCATCPQNAFGSNKQTGRGKACSDHKIIVIAWERDPEVFATLKVPTMSLAALKKLDTALRDANIPQQAVLCEFKFNQQYTYPVLDIGAVGFVDEQTAMRMIAAKDTEEVQQLLRNAVDQEEGSQEQKTEEVVPNTVVQFGGAASPSDVGTAATQEPEKPRRPRTVKPKAEAAPAPEPEQEIPVEGELVEEPVQQAQTAASSNVMDLLKKWSA